MMSQQNTTQTTPSLDGHTPRVLVTGATGFIANHVIIQLLEAGYRVRGTARSRNSERELRAVLGRHTDKLANFELFEANLETDQGWRLATSSCDYVHHVASPIPRKPPKHENDLIVPATEGALRVLKAASKADVKRVVMTSSVAAIIYGHEGSEVFTESNWSNLNSSKIGAYEKSKTHAEQAAWDFISTPEANGLELVCINPGLVLGPVMSSDWGTSGEVIKKLMQKDFPAVPNLGWSMVDVRDVAAAHLAAMTNESAAGQRFICSSQFASLREVAHILDQKFGQKYRIPTRKMPDFVLKLAAVFDKTARLGLNDLSVRRELDNSKIKEILNWKPRNLDEMVTAMGESFIEYGVV